MEIKLRTLEQFITDSCGLEAAAAKLGCCYGTMWRLSKGKNKPCGILRSNLVRYGVDLASLPGATPADTQPEVKDGL